MPEKTPKQQGNALLDAAQQTPPKKRSGRRGDQISLAPLTPDQAMRGLLKVKLSDVKKLEAAEKASKAGTK